MVPKDVCVLGYEVLRLILIPTNSIGPSFFLPTLDTINCRYQASKLRAVVDASSETGTASKSTSSSSDHHLKYLTNSQLLHLQLRDAEMRLHFLTQLLIMTSYLSSTIATHGPKVIKVTEIVRALAAIRKRAEVLMKQTPPNGASHLKTVEWILTEREAMWRKWKSNKCQPDIEAFGIQKAKAADDADAEEAKKRKRRRLMMSGSLGGGGAAADPTASASGAADLYSYRLDVQKDLPSVARKMVECVPPLSTFLEEYVEALDPENGIEAEYHPRNDKPFAWRAMRLLARDHLGSFGGVRRKDGDFERVVRSIWKEEKDVVIPGDEPEAEEVVDFDELRAKENAEASTKAKATKKTDKKKQQQNEEADAKPSGANDAPSVGEVGAASSMEDEEEPVIRSEEDKQMEFGKIALELGLVGGAEGSADGANGTADMEDEKEASASEADGGNANKSAKKKRNNRGKKRKADSIDETEKKESGDAKIQQEAKKAKTDNNSPRGGNKGGGGGGRGGGGRGGGGRGGGGNAHGQSHGGRGGGGQQRGGPPQGDVRRGPSPTNRGGGGPQNGGRDWDRGRGPDGPQRGRDWERGPAPPGGDGRRRSQSGGRRGRR